MDMSFFCDMSIIFLYICKLEKSINKNIAL